MFYILFWVLAALLATIILGALFGIVYTLVSIKTEDWVARRKWKKIEQNWDARHIETYIPEKTYDSEIIWAAVKDYVTKQAVYSELLAIHEDGLAEPVVEARDLMEDAEGTVMSLLGIED